MMTMPDWLLQLLDAVQYAQDVLDDYADVEDGDDGRPIPNRAMLAMTELKNAVRIVDLQHRGAEGEIL